MKLAIVGSTKFHDDWDASYWACSQMNEFIELVKPDLIISGGAIGIDSLAIIVAMDLGIEYKEYLPKNKRWFPEGFMDRNLLIARECDALLRISHPASTTYGSGWTADRAEEMGKWVKRIHYKEPNE